MLSATRTAALLLACLFAAPLEGRAAEKAPLSFGVGKAKSSESLGFGGSRSDGSTNSRPASERDETYARGLLKKYDTNGDRVLQEEEWKKISGSPEKADSNGDKKITFTELVDRVSQRRREREASGSAGTSDRRSYRVITAQEKLPEGLPGWFTDKDRNGDGQVSMHEYSRRWTDSTARRFLGLDKNDDGLITADEALKGR